MPKFLTDEEIQRLENFILSKPDAEKTGKKYEEYKVAVEMITPLIDELRRYCFKGCFSV